ncbi:cupin domain-containing protein [Candidatus Rariloculus sp.]|uniref:cupin domain-containing protein n=1 Tax=Candidatus Rariloculus sp. TaxID=3101265 RepID=UPI003D129D69
MDEDVRRIVERFGMTPHPEGGFFREVYRSAVSVEHPAVPPGHAAGRRGGTLIYFLLSADQFSAFHRVKWTDELWHLYAGGPLELHVIDDERRHTTRLLTTELDRGDPTTLVEAGHWQAARLAANAKWAFGGCTVSPGFEFDDFEMPPAEVLIAQYCEHAGIIRELTRR